MESPAERRIEAIQQQLCSDQDHASLLRRNETAREFVLGTFHFFCQIYISNADK